MDTRAEIERFPRHLRLCRNPDDIQSFCCVPELMDPPDDDNDAFDDLQPSDWVA